MKVINSKHAMPTLLVTTPSNDKLVSLHLEIFAHHVVCNLSNRQNAAPLRTLRSVGTWVDGCPVRKHYNESIYATLSLGIQPRILHHQMCRVETRSVVTEMRDLFNVS